MANNLNQLKNDFKTSMNSNLDAATKTKLINRMISAYQSEWDALIASGTADTAANRGDFVAKKVMDYLKNIFTAGSQRENYASVPAPDVLN